MTTTAALLSQGFDRGITVEPYPNPEVVIRSASCPNIPLIGECFMRSQETGCPVSIGTWDRPSEEANIGPASWIAIYSFLIQPLYHSAKVKKENETFPLSHKVL